MSALSATVVSAEASVTPANAAPWQSGFLSLLPTVETHAEISFRRLSAEKKEDAVQEAVAAACVSYRLAGREGEAPRRLPQHHRHLRRQTRPQRQARRGPPGHAAKDALSPVVHRRHGVRVRWHGGWTELEGWKRVLVADRNEAIPDTVAFRMDFGDWLGTLNGRDREVCLALAEGGRTRDVAERFKLSEARISQLRRRFERDWQVFQGVE